MQSFTVIVKLFSVAVLILAAHEHVGAQDIGGDQIPSAELGPPEIVWWPQSFEYSKGKCLVKVVIRWPSYATADEQRRHYGQLMYGITRVLGQRALIYTDHLTYSWVYVPLFQTCESAQAALDIIDGGVFPEDLRVALQLMAGEDIDALSKYDQLDYNIELDYDIETTAFSGRMRLDPTEKCNLAIEYDPKDTGWPPVLLRVAFRHFIYAHHELLGYMQSYHFEPRTEDGVTAYAASGEIPLACSFAEKLISDWFLWMSIELGETLPLERIRMTGEPIE